MSFFRTWKCDFEECGQSYTEPKMGEGAPGWGGLVGVLLDGHEVKLCPEHLKKVCDFIRPPKVEEKQ